MSNDTTLQRSVIDELAWDPALRNTEVGVAARDGVVTLSGKVYTFAQKYAAEKAVHRVAGVKALANDIAVHLLPEHKRTDTEIAHTILNVLNWNVAVPDDKLQVDVEDGWVTLRGAVDWDYQRRAAENSIRSLLGVRGITDLVSVKPHVSVSDVKDKIEAAFKRSADIDADRINVTASDGKVTLRGKVRSWAERNDAERAAWAAPGVREVSDEITLTM